ncbi:neoverrucotoxin subunit alpha-like [Parambassis ranga]|uniref:Neoverrucotoxin subunit alpha-like n=1 Tax=Parambassis ranga TaxID=210632 RepID=A0A6P7HWE6_9TELE|nr:neoverrucotoxin subunit alpha-like [Parambassis ranga]
MSRTDGPSQQNDQKQSDDDGPDPEDGLTGQAERQTISTLALLKEDFTHFKEEVRKVFKDPRTNQRPPERQVNPLTVLKEDFNHLKEDLSSVFRINLTKERDHKEVPSCTFKIKASEEPFKSLFRRDQNPSKRSQQEVDVKRAVCEDDDGDQQKDEEFQGQNEENNNMKDSEDGEQEDVTEEETAKSFCDGLRAEEASAAHRCESEEQSGASSEGSDKDDQPSERRLWDALPRVRFLSQRDVSQGELREEPEENLWSLKNFSCYLTLDPNTANSELQLTAGNRKAQRVWSEQWTPDHPERFEHCPQVLCREGLLDSVYWEVEWSGGADIGVTYNSISRDGEVEGCLLGHNERSWSLECAEGSYTPCHNRKRFRAPSPEPFSHRVGVYLNWPAGTLSFYCVSRDAMVHLHTFTSTFTEPLYPGFWVWAYGGSVSLRQVELDWERLLQ